jgi:hypothetical protein
MAQKPKKKTPKTQEKKEIHLKTGQKLGAHGKPVPLSEHERKYKEWTKKDCIDHLRSLQNANPDMFISRNWFRHHSDISDATWNRHFGTFQEFKRSAGIDLSRHAGRLEKQIAKHAGHDDIEKFTNQKHSYIGKYEKPSSSRFQTVMVCSDVHDEFCDPFWRRVWLETVERVQPEIIVLNGDIFDLAEFGKYEKDPRDWDITRKIRMALDFIRDCREAAPNAQIDFIEGNHEFRLFRHLAEATPALKTILADLHGFTIPKLLGLDEFEINFVGTASLKAWTEKDIKKELSRNYKIYFDTFLCCHFPDRRRLGMSGVGGHHHKHEVWPIRNPYGIAGEFHQMGAGHYRAADYADGEIWHMGFMIIHADTLTKNPNFEYVPVTDHAVVGGQWYLRTDQERIV